MTDIALVWDPVNARADLAIAGNDLQADNGLTTAAILSLFCDRQADPDDMLPDDASTFGGANLGTGDRRGWWGDWYAPAAIEALRAQGSLDTTIAPGTLPTPAPNDRVGSRLWLLSREKETAEAVARCDDYVTEGLQWLTDDGVAGSVTVNAKDAGNGTLAFAGAIAQPAGNPVGFAYAYAWKAMS